jgi:ketosteroid isomerase-like protein
MGVHRPGDVNAAFADGFNRRDVDAMLALYDPDGAVVEMDGTMSVGHAQIRRHLERLIELGGEMVSTNLTAVELGDLALVTAEWVITGTMVAPRMNGRSSRGAPPSTRRHLGVPDRPARVIAGGQPGNAAASALRTMPRSASDSLGELPDTVTAQVTPSGCTSAIECAFSIVPVCPHASPP